MHQDIDNTHYQSPLETRYASREMSRLFSPQVKHSMWRKLWVTLAESQKELGLAITDEQLKELGDHLEDIDFRKAEGYEKECRHDVMAHIYAYGDVCPKAKAIIHLGATSCYVTDNADIIIMKEGLRLLRSKLKGILEALAAFSRKYAHLPCLGYTHLQPAQLTTVGKRACLWLQDLLMDFEEILYREEQLRFLGAKGTTGTQASFLSLFEGDHDKVKELDRRVAEKMGFNNIFPISGQTYTRKQDAFILNALAGIASSAHKMATDIRLLAAFKELEEPFGKGQIGSSAMPYKRNPMLCERICSLSRFMLSLTQNAPYTHAVQWMERSLDDSANRRLTLAETFLTADALLELLMAVTDGLVVNEKVIEKRVFEELPFMATENILMASVKKGGDRQELHEKIRQHSLKAGERVKGEGKENDLLSRLASDDSIPLSRNELDELLDIRQFIGRSPQQVEEFLSALEAKRILKLSARR